MRNYFFVPESVEKRKIYQQMKKYGGTKDFLLFHLFFHRLWKNEDVHSFSKHLLFFAEEHQANSLQMLLISYSKALSPDILLLMTSMDERIVV